MIVAIPTIVGIDARGETSLGWVAKSHKINANLILIAIREIRDRGSERMQAVCLTVL
jgi:hypothetical protein